MKLLTIIILCVSFIESIVTEEEEYKLYSTVGKYYKFHRKPLTWFNARIACQNENATLALPENEAEMNILTTYFNANYPSHDLSDVIHKDFILTGFHDHFSENEYISLHGKSMQYFFHKWGDGQPDNFGDEDCGSLHRSGVINDFPCGVRGVFMCEKSNNRGVYLETSHTDDPAYKCKQELDLCYKLHWNPKRWADARAVCSAEGGQLAIIRSKVVEKFLLEMFNKPEDHVRYVKRPNEALIGVHDLFSKGHFVTVEDKDIESYGYDNWLSLLPRNATKSHCGSMTREGTINDFPCSVHAVFLCEKRKGLHYKFTPQ